VISAARIRECDVFDLLKDLGYPVEPIEIVASERADQREGFRI